MKPVLILCILLTLILTVGMLSCDNGEEAPPSTEPTSTTTVTYEQLVAAQEEAGQLLEELGLLVDSDINIKESQVEVYVTDSKLFNKTLQEAEVQLPDHVVPIIIYEPLYEIPFEINPDPSVCFPQLKMRSGSFMEALLIGELVLEDCYLRIDGNLIIWQADYFVNNNEGTIEILDRNGNVVARVGEEVYMGGGRISSLEHINKLIKELLPQDCEGPFWLQGDETRLNLNYSSDLFSLEVLTDKDRKYYFIRKKPLLDTFFIKKEVITGKLVACYDAYCLKCPTILVGEVPLHYTPLWPAECKARIKNGLFEVLDASGKVVAREREEVQLEGNLRCGIHSDVSKQLHNELPGQCSTCYFNVLKIIDSN